MKDNIREEKSREQALIEWENSTMHNSALHNAFVKFNKYGDLIYINMVKYQAWYEYDNNGNLIYTKIINCNGTTEIHNIYDENNNYIRSY